MFTFCDLQNSVIFLSFSFCRFGNGHYITRLYLLYFQTDFAIEEEDEDGNGVTGKPTTTTEKQKPTLGAIGKKQGWNPPEIQVFHLALLPMSLIIRYRCPSFSKWGSWITSLVVEKGFYCAFEFRSKACQRNNKLFLSGNFFATKEYKKKRFQA